MPITHILTANDWEESQTSSMCSNGIQRGCDQESSNGLNISQHVPVLVDTDAGIDDAWALMMLAEAHKSSTIPVNIEAITCVHGNTNVDNVVKNVGRVLSVSGLANEIPIYSGCETAFAVPFQENDDAPLNGSDGFGDVGNWPTTMASPTAASKHAVNKIVNLAKHHNGALIVLALGPLTNLAMAVRMEPKIMHLIKEIFVLGGNGKGCGEFNFVADPESAHVVLSSFTCPIYLIPWQTSEKYGVSSHAWRVKTIGSIQTQQMKLLNAIEYKILDEFRDGWMANAAVAVAAFLDPKIIKKQEACHCTVELQGIYSRGLLVVDPQFKLQKQSNVMIVQDIDLQLLQTMLIWAVGGPYYL